MQKNVVLICAAAALILAIGMLSGCTEATQATSPVAASLASVEADNTAFAAVQHELTRLAGDGIDPASAKGILELEWRDAFNPQSPSETVVGSALAVGFESTQPAAGVRRGLVDMGSVSLNYGSTQLPLQKHTGPDGGIMYSSFPERRATEPVSIPFIAGSSYEFNISGSAKFTALQTAITSPEALLSLSAPAKDGTIGSSADLTVAWRGGDVEGKILLVIAAEPPQPVGAPPQGGPPQGVPPQGGPPQGGPPPRPDSARSIIVHLDGNPGSFTVGASAVHDLVEKTGAKSLRVMVSQLTVRPLDHDGGVILLVLRNSDGERVAIQ